MQNDEQPQPEQVIRPNQSPNQNPDQSNGAVQPTQPQKTESQPANQPLTPPQEQAQTIAQPQAEPAAPPAVPNEPVINQNPSAPANTPSTATPMPTPTEDVQQTQQPESFQQPTAQDQEEAGWKFNPESPNNTLADQFNTSDPEQLAQNEMPNIDTSWTASEFIAHEKSAMWYIRFALAMVVVVAVIYFLTRDVTSAAVIAFMAIIFMVVAGRKPRVLNYAIDSQAVHVGSKTYPLTMFKSFTIIEEGAINSIMLIPLRRFSPPMTLYYEPTDEQKIAESLSGALPYEDREQDAIDKLMRKIRF